MLASTVGVASSRMSSAVTRRAVGVELQLLQFAQKDVLVVAAPLHHEAGLGQAQVHAQTVRSLGHQPLRQLPLLGRLVLEHVAVLLRRRAQQHPPGEASPPPESGRHPARVTPDTPR